MENIAALYLVATPIGNLEDISHRAITTLKTVASIAAEDTRHTLKLLQYYGIQTPCFSLHEFNESSRIPSIVRKLEAGESIALVSDAGTPLISDPGYRLVSAISEAGFKVVPIPGACALIAALIASGLATDRFVFEGFLPQKGAARSARIAALITEMRTMIFYESPRRILATLIAMREGFGGARRACIARELTKTFETVRRDSLASLCAWVEANPGQQRGEYVLVVDGCDEAQDSVEDSECQRILSILLDKMTLKAAVMSAQKILNGDRNRLYEMALELKKKDRIQ